VHRDGLAPALPERLPAAPAFVWKKPLPTADLAGIAVSDGVVLVAGRDVPDQRDVFLCLRAADGEQVWELSYPAPGSLDYGPSPRATPLIRASKAYLLGAFGDLHWVRLADGKILWSKNLIRDFGAPRPKWGFSASPLIIEGKLIVNPGAKKSALVALDPFTGKTIWTVPGSPAAYASVIAGTFGGRTQIVGYDQSSLGGWDPDTGRCLWRLVPPIDGDFNVPTPIAWQGKLVVATENNGARVYDFNRDGTIMAKPVASCTDLAPDVNSPIVVKERLFGCHGDLYCLDLKTRLKKIWAAADPAFANFVTLIGGPDRVLLTSYRGELLLLSATGESCRILSRLRLVERGAEVFSHPALVGSHLFIRVGGCIGCVELAPPEPIATTLASP
jgi:outer membrane protein assembly factor BamB